jgi:hypothetical protein
MPRRWLVLLWLAILCAVAWVIGFGVYHVASAAIHVLLILAVISLIFYFIRGVTPTRAP